MKVNLNNNISQSKLNFSANFSSNNKTQVTLEKMLEKDPVSTLALKLAIEDSDDKGVIYAKEVKSGFSSQNVNYRLQTYDILRSGNYYRQEEITSDNIEHLLKMVCDKKVSKEKSQLLTSTPKKNFQDYINQARNILNPAKDTDLVNKKRMIKQQIANLQKELEGINTHFRNETIKIAKKHLL